MGALDGIRVIDFGHYVAGPATGMLLADQGAEVIKVDPPGGPCFQSPANRTWNRGKKSICLDLGRTEDAETARQLMASADVVIENFRPGRMDAWGLGQKAMREQNPALIYLSIPGFAAADPRSKQPGWEGAIYAATDAIRPAAAYRDMIQSLHQRPEERTGTPRLSSEAMASLFASILGATSIAAALNHRVRTGRGGWIELPLFDAMLQTIGVFGSSVVPFQAMTSPIFPAWDHQYACADGGFIHLTISELTGTEKFARALGREDWIEKGLIKDGLEGEPEKNNQLTEELTTLFATRTTPEWEALFTELEVPGVAVRTGAGWEDHPQAKGGDLLARVDDPDLGPMKQPGLQVKLYDTPGAIRGPAPKPDEQRSEILKGLEGRKAPAFTAKGGRSKAPFEGLKVLDLCIVLAGPTCGRTFVDLGGDVIKVEQPGRSNFPYHMDINRGKRTVVLDLKSDKGREILWQLIDRADVVVQNFRQGVIDRLGFGFEAVHARNPRAVYVSLNAYGDTGPWAALPGYEELAEAMTGMQARYGGADDPKLWPYGVVCDYGTGFAGAYAAMLALLAREKSGKGQHVHSALARTACTLQSLHMQYYEGKDWNELTGEDAMGSSPRSRIYPCQDGWVFLGAKDEEALWQRLGKGPSGDIEDALTAWCADQNMEDAVKHFSSPEIAAHGLTWLNDALEDPLTVERGLAVTREHEFFGPMRTVGPGPWYSEFATTPGKPAPLTGRDAASVLADIGREDELEALVEQGVLEVP